MYPGVQAAGASPNASGGYVYAQTSPEPGGVPVAQPVLYYAQQPMGYAPQPVAYGQPQGYEVYGQPQAYSQAQPGQPVYAAQPVRYSQSSAPPGPVVYGTAGNGGQTIIVQQGGIIPIAPISMWRTELFDCCQEPGICVLSLLFPCATIGQNEEMKSGPNGVGCFCSGLTACAIFTLCSFIPFLWPLWPCYLGSQRSSTRALYNIQGDSCTDCLCHLVCSPVSQDQKHKKTNNFLSNHSDSVVLLFLSVCINTRIY
jgi:Cys-rich protein (TIGR01571 family)